MESQVGQLSLQYNNKPTPHTYRHNQKINAKPNINNALSDNEVTVHACDLFELAPDAEIASQSRQKGGNSISNQHG
jgi:hypothetical protein